jgi:uncharacterized protein (TIGR00730 family)
MRVTVFGGSAPKPGDTAYLEAQHLGELLVKAGHVVVTGGYMGVMEAASRGASESGGKVIGVTCKDIEDWRPIDPNMWVGEIIQEKTLFERLKVLIHDSDAYLALPGGPGTLVEISLVWNLLIIHALPHKPMILIGQSWKRVIDTFTAEHFQYLPAGDEELLHYADDVDQAVTLLEMLTKSD